MRFEVTGKDLTRITRELKRMDNREVKKRFRRELRAAAKPMVPAVRSSIMSIPAKGTGHTGLRNRLAKAVTLNVRTSGRSAGVRVRVAGEKMPSGERALPKYMEGTKSPWRHPVYGNRTVWVKQEPHPYFYRVARLYGHKARHNVIKAVNKISRDIT